MKQRGDWGTSNTETDEYTSAFYPDWERWHSREMGQHPLITEHGYARLEALP